MASPWALKGSFRARYINCTTPQTGQRSTEDGGDGGYLEIVDQQHSKQDPVIP